MIRVISDDLYVVRVQGRAAEEDSLDDHGL